MSELYFDVKLSENTAETDLSASEKRRFRITRACDYCRKKKVKCYFNPGQACSNCVSFGMTCEFNDGAKKRGPPKGYIDALEKRIKKIEESLQNPGTHETRNSTTYVSSVPSTPSTPVISHSPSPGPSRHESVHTINASNKKSQGSSADRVQYLGDMSSFQFFSNKIKLNDKNTKWKGHEIRRFGKQVVLVEDNKTEDEQLPPSELLPHVKPIDYWIYSVTGVDKHTSDRLLKIYFANIHPVLPVVNKTRFLEQYRDQTDTYPPADLLNSMFGAAARFVECEALTQKSKSSRAPDTVWNVPFGWSDQFFEQAQILITSSASTASLSKVQAIILIHNHSGNMNSKSAACWLLGGLAIRLAQSLGLNRDCEEWDIPESEKQTRKRIWWSLYVADRFYSASLGRPISIRDEDNDVGYPDSTASWKEVLDEPEEKESTGVTPLSNISRFPSAMCRPKKIEGRVGIYQLFIELIKLSEILGRILQGLYTPKAKKIGLEQGSDAIVTQLDHQLTEWRFGFPEALQKAAFEDFDENKGYLAPVAASVLLCYFSLLILLHRPFIEAAATSVKKPHSSYSSFRIGTSAATRGIRIASQMSIRDFLMFPYSFSLYLVLQCCLIHMYNTKNPDARLSAPAKVDLAKGMALISRLRVMSGTAQRLYQLLKTIMNNKDIEVAIPMSDSEDSIRSRDNSIDISTIPSRVSDVGRGSNSSDSGNSRKHQSRQHSQILATQRQQSSQPISMQSIQLSNTRIISQSPTDMHYPTIPFQQTLAEAMVSHNIDGSMSATSVPSPTSMSEAFTLKQFGFKDTLGDPNQLDYTMQDTSSFSQMEALPPMPNIYNNNNNNNQEQQQQNSYRNNNTTTATTTYPYQPQSVLSNATTATTTTNNTNNNATSIPINMNMFAPASANSTQTLPMTNNSNISLLDNSNEGLFKNNPNNPFFGIPTSMDWTEWNEWNQSTQGIAAWQPNSTEQ